MLRERGWKALEIPVQGRCGGAWRQGDVCVIKASHLGLHSKFQISQSYKTLSQIKQKQNKKEKEKNVVEESLIYSSFIAFTLPLK